MVLFYSRKSPEGLKRTVIWPDFQEEKKKKKSLAARVEDGMRKAEYKRFRETREEIMMFDLRR